ncbi:MAG: hypothetical protein ACRDYF_08250, partial [Acidimicrobiia bacterium]
VEFVQATDTDDGVVAPGIQITRKQEAAAAGTTMVVRYTLGRTLAAARIEPGVSTPDLDLGGTPAPDFGSPSDADPQPTVPPPTDTGASSSASALSAAPDATAASSSSSFGAAGSGFTAGTTGSSSATGGDLAAPAGDTAAPAEAAGSVDASLASAPVATGPIAPLSSWSFFPMMLLAGAAVAAVALGRKILVRS